MYLNAGAIDVCVGDLNNDGIDDIVLTDAQVSTTIGGWNPQPRYDFVALQLDWSISPPRPVAAYALPTPIWDRGNTTSYGRSHDRHCLIADLNGDGKKDLLLNSTYRVAQGENWQEVNNIQVYLHRGNFVFDDISERAFPGKTTEGSSTDHFFLRDLNGDGILDQFVSSNAFTSANPNYVWLGNGDGTFRRDNSVDFATLYASARETIAKAGVLPKGVASSQLYPRAVIPLKRQNSTYDFFVPMELLANAYCNCTTTMYVTLATPGLRFK